MRTCVVSLMSVLMVTSPVLAQSFASARTISVSGTAEVRVTPSLVNLVVGVETRNRSLAAAKAILKFLSLTFWWTHLLIAEAFCQGSTSPRVTRVAWLGPRHVAIAAFDGTIKLVDLRKCMAMDEIDLSPSHDFATALAVSGRDLYAVTSRGVVLRFAVDVPGE